MRELHGKKRVFRWIKGILLGTVGFVALVLVSAIIFFHTSMGREVLRSQIESRMNGAFVGGATVGGIEGSPFSELVLKDVVINGPDREPAIKVKRLTVKLPLLPLISHQLRVDKIIADDLDVKLKRYANGELQIGRLMKPGPKSTWSVKLPNVEVHRGHVAFDTGTEIIDLDHVELLVDAKLPFAGPTDAALTLSAFWRQRQAQVAVGSVIHDDRDAFTVKNLVAKVGDVGIAVAGASIPKSPFAKPFAGTVAIHAPAAAVKKLVPEIDLPADVAVAITAVADGRLTHFAINGAVGNSQIRGFVRADVQAKLALGTLTATDLDLAQLTRGKLDGHGGAVVSFDVDGTGTGELPKAKAVVTAWGKVGDAPAANAVIALDTAGDLARVVVGATNAGVRAGVHADLRKRGNSIVLERSEVVAYTDSPKAATGGKAPLRGVLDAHLRASGPLAPHLDLAVAGHVDGRRLRVADLSADKLRLRIDAKHLPDKPVGTARVELAGIRRGDMQLGKLTVAAGNRPDGKLQVTVRSQPKPAPWLIDADALVTLGDTTVVEMQRHVVRAAGGSIWSGTTGRITIDPKRIEVRDLRTASKQGNIAASGFFVRTGRNAGDLAAKLDADLELSNLAKAYAGHVEAHVDVARTQGHLAGTIEANGKGIHVMPKAPGTFDANVKISAKADQVLADMKLESEKVGDVALALDVDAPKDIADVDAWRKLGRNAIRTAKLSLDNIDLKEAAKAAGLSPMSGKIDGSIEITPAAASGSIAIRGVSSPQMKDLGTINADIKVTEPVQNELLANITARLIPTPTAVAAKDVTKDGEARFHAESRFGAPARLFDPAAWKQLGANAFRGGSLRAERLAFQPGTLERLGIVSALRGELALGIDVEEGMKAVRVSVRAHNLRGGLLAQPITANVSAEADAKSSRLVATVVADNITILRVSSQIPVTLDQLRANPELVKTAKLDGTATIDHVPAKTLMTTIGTSQLTGGFLDGKVEVKGTVDRPTVDAKIVATDVTVPAEGKKSVQMIQKLTIDANWDGARGKLAIDGNESAGGVLRIRVEGEPDKLDEVTGSLFAHKLDIAPLVAFMPGPAGGLGGQLEASFALKGLDLRTAEVTGKLRVTDGRIPIAPTVGTLFKGDVRINVQNRVVDLHMTGKLGRGDVKLVASAPLDGVTPKSGKLELTIKKVQLIGQTEPILTGVITADIARVNDRWRTNLRVEKMTVKVPPEKGNKLSPVGAPTDLVYGGEKIHHGVKKGTDAPPALSHDHGPGDFKVPAQVEASPEGAQARRKVPDDPLLVAEVTLRNTYVEAEEMRGLVGGKLTISVDDNKEVGIVGTIWLMRGVLDLFNRRYVVDKAQLSFDGSPDPRLDVRITHDFPDVTTITEVRGRMSKPDLILSSQPGRYSQAELLGFLLGGEPGGDPELAPSASERVAGAGASFLSNKLGGYVKKALPVDVDVLRYEAESSTSSAAITVGTWITDTLFLAYRRHLEARPDENSGEGEVEYWLRRRLVLEAVAGDRGVNGVDLLWRRRW